MKRNNLIENLTNFLVPIVAIYAIFLVASHINEGIFAIFYAILLILASAIIFLTARDKSNKLRIFFALPRTLFSILFVSLSYIISVFIFLII